MGKEVNTAEIPPFTRVYIVYHDALFSERRPTTLFPEQHRAPLDLYSFDLWLLRQITDDQGKLCFPAKADDHGNVQPLARFDPQAPHVADLLDKIKRAMVAHHFERADRRFDGPIEDFIGNGVTFERVEFESEEEQADG